MTEEPGRSAGARGAGAAGAVGAAGAIVAAANLRVDAAGAELRAALGAAGVDHLLLRGRSFARLLYDHDWERAYSDTDLLVPEAACDRAFAVAEGLGYVRLDFEVIADGAMTFCRSADGALADVHWRLRHAKAPPDAVWSLLQRHRVPLEVGGHIASVLDAPASALLIALHAAHHGTERPGALEDVRRATVRLPVATWADARELAERARAADAFAAGLRVTAEGSALADSLGLGSPMPPWLWLKTHDGDERAERLARLAATPGRRDRAVLAARLLVPPPHLMRTFVPLARRGRLGLAAAYVLRPAMLARRAPAALRDWGRARSAARGRG